MDKEIIRNVNTVVAEEDTLYIIGDLSLVGSQHLGYYRNLMGQYKVKRKILILGNHDILKPFTYVNLGFESVHTSLELEHNGKSYILVHDPAASCLDRNRIFLCGHVHDLFKFQRNAINVGVDVWDFFPVSIEQIEAEALGLKMG